VRDDDGDALKGEVEMFVTRDMTRILEYGQAHPDDYGGRWTSRADGAYCATFTKGLAQHEAALRSVLGLPERLKVQRCAHSYAELLAVCDRLRLEDWDPSEVDHGGKPAINGFGPREREGVVRVRVRSGRPDVARRLLSKYGSIIHVEEDDSNAVLF
jgi:hypothetical protein